MVPGVLDREASDIKREDLDVPARDRTRRIMNHLPNLCSTTFACTIVYDRHPGIHRPDNCFCVRIAESVIENQKEIYRSGRFTRYAKPTPSFVLGRQDQETGTCKSEHHPHTDAQHNAVAQDRAVGEITQASTALWTKCARLAAGEELGAASRSTTVIQKPLVSMLTLLIHLWLVGHLRNGC